MRVITADDAMGKKKKGGKTKKENAEGGLPPPPNLDSYKEGAREALLTFKIQGKEDSIQQYEEEADDFKDKNYRQKEKNYELKTVQAGHRRVLFQQAIQYETEQAEKEEVSQETVETAMWAKLQLAQDIEAELQDPEDNIVTVGQQLEIERKELEKWQKYKENTARVEEAYIKRMRNQMVEMKEKEMEAENEQGSKLSAAKLEIEAKWQKRMESEKAAVSEKLLNSLDREGRAEMRDNGWLKREIRTVSETVSELKREVDCLEQRNLCLLEDMQREQLQELEISIGLLQASTGHSRHSLSHTSDMLAGDGSPSLPSLVDISKNSGSRGIAGKLGQMERQMLNIQGHVAPMVFPPDPTHLPPLVQQKSSHSALPPCTAWPITAEMLDSIAQNTA